MIRPKGHTSPKYRFQIPIGGCIDIPTGRIVEGMKGESIIMGGLPTISGVVGIGNNFKSTIVHWMMMQALDRVQESHDSIYDLYDTEVNVVPERLAKLSQRFEHIDSSLLEDASLSPILIEDKTTKYADEWMSGKREFLESKMKDKKSHIETPIKGHDGKAITTLIPTFTAVDSLSEFEDKKSIEMTDKNALGSSETTTSYLAQGLMRSKFISELPRTTSEASNYICLTAHVGKDKGIGKGRFEPDTKKLQHLKHNDVIKGVSDKFYFLTGMLWNAFNSAPLINSSTKGPEYPRTNSREDVNEGIDLHKVVLKQLRSKYGGSGYTIELLVSQTDGVLPELTEFHNIRLNNAYGISGNNIKYHLDILPEITISRPTIRSMLDSNKKLTRAVNITSELLQLHEHRSNELKDLLCSPKELYDDIKELGYDWDVLLDTRGYYTFNQYVNKVNFLSTVDLLKMRKELYRPYWLKK